MGQDDIKTALDAQKKLVKLSEQRTGMAAGRTYMNAERTLSVWIRTALSVMTFGIAIAEIEILFPNIKFKHENILWGYTPIMITGILLVVVAIFMGLTSGGRFWAFRNNYKKEYPLPALHTGRLPVIYAFMTVAFGILLLILLLVIK